ncbi:MAG: sulfotransferase domain-containing protein [Sulfurimonas sp.]
MDFKKKHKLIIAGVHKGASTSLYEYLIHHAKICAGKTKEVHYYTPLRYGKDLAPLDDYIAEFKNCFNEKYVLDASPSYLYGDTIPSRIKNDLNNVKIIVILRNPSERFISFYLFLKSEFRIPENVTFKDFLKKSYNLKDHEDKDDVYHRASREGVYADYLDNWFKIFGNNFKVIFFDDLKNQPKSVMQDICHWLKISDNVYEDNSIFTIRNQTRQSKSKLVYKISSFLNNKFEFFFRKNPAVKDKLKSLYFAINGRNASEEISIETKQELDKLYLNENKRLAHLLLQQGYSNLPSWVKEL